MLFMLKISGLSLTIIAAAVMLLPTTARAGEVLDREIDQQHRIEQGVRNGTINRQEYRNLERREASINRQRLYDDRHGMTPAEREQLNQRLNHLSHSIYEDKHN